MDKSPVISDVKREVYGQAEAAIGRFFDGRISAEELADSCRSLSGRLMDACKDRGYPMPLWGGMMGPAFQETFYGEFRRMVLDEAVNRNNAEGKQYVTGDTISVSSLTIEHPDGTTTFIDYTKPGFDPTNPAKGTTWAAYKDEGGTWRYESADFTYDFSKDDLKNVAGLLKFSGQSGGAQEAVNRFLKNLQVYPGGYFSRFPQLGALSMNPRA